MSNDAKQLRVLYEQNKKQIMKKVRGLYRGVRIEVDFYPDEGRVGVSDYMQDNTDYYNKPTFYAVYRGLGDRPIGNKITYAGLDKWFAVNLYDHITHNEELNGCEIYEDKTAEEVFAMVGA